MKKLINEIIESFRIAVEQVNQHRMRSLLTALGVIIGIIAVTLMGTAIKGIDIGFQDSLDMLGTDTFYVEKWPWRDPGDDWMKFRNRPNLQARYAAQLNEIIQATPDSSLVIAVPTLGSRQRIERGTREISGVNLIGTNSDFTITDTATIAYGRFFTDSESVAGRNVAVIGHDVAEALFPDSHERAVGQSVKIRDVKYMIVGVYAKQGSFLGLQSFDRNVVMPLASLRKFFVNRWWNSATIKVQKWPEATVEEARDEITGAMRRIRALHPDEENDFEVNQSDAIEEQLGPIKSGLALAGFFITGLALFVGAIGIMNITFVSVKERTKEIGTRRAIGARRRSILMQFLTESSMICFLGGITGLALSYALKLLIAQLAPDFPLVMSAELIVVAVAISIGTGIVSGFAPALQAASLDPAEALRHE
jgi:putative ABC transport system permease protein